MDDLGKCCDENIAQDIKDGTDGKINGDNVDFRVSTHEMRMNIKSKDFHLFESDYTPDRIDLTKYDANVSVGDPNSVKLENVLPSADEDKHFRESLKVVLAREIIELSDKFLWMEMFVSEHIPHELSTKMSQKSTPFLMPINETSYSDCIGILTSYCSQLEDRYTRAGRGSHAIFMSLELKFIVMVSLFLLFAPCLTYIMYMYQIIRCRYM